MHAAASIIDSSALLLVATSSLPLRLATVMSATATGVSDKNIPAAAAGRLTGKVPGSALDFDLYDGSHTIESLFGQSLSGAALLESILAWYVDTEQDVPWFAADSTRTVVRSPLSRPLQDVTVCRYMDRIRDEGLSQIVAGRAGEGGGGGGGGGGRGRGWGR